jgi:hypothetical protein
MVYALRMSFFEALRPNKSIKASEETRLEYDNRVARFRTSEYPMLKGQCIVPFRFIESLIDVRADLPRSRGNNTGERIIT